MKRFPDPPGLPNEAEAMRPDYYTIAPPVLMIATVDHTGRHTVWAMRADGAFFQYDPHSRTWDTLPKLPHEPLRT